MPDFTGCVLDDLQELSSTAGGNRAGCPDEPLRAHLTLRVA